MLIETIFYSNYFRIFNSSKLMKTSQIKKFMPAHTKSIKLKFENIKPQQPNPKFSTEDLPNINYVYKNIEETLRNGHAISQDSLRILFDIVKRVKKTVDQMEAQNNKIRFRVVKSAKKSNFNEVFNQKTNQAEQEFNKSTVTLPILSLSQNRTQSGVMENKQNSPSSSNNNIYGNKSTFSSTCNGKIKLKKFEPKPLQICEETEIRPLPHQQANFQLRTKIKALGEEIEEKNKMIKALQSDINILNNKMQNEQNVRIELKLSLKCVEDRPEIKQGLAKQIGKKVQQNEEIRNKYKLEGSKYGEQYTNHLKLMIVSQNKQIEALHKKITDCERDVVKKSSRWNVY